MKLNEPQEHEGEPGRHKSKKNQKFLTVREACKAIFWSSPGFKREQEDVPLVEFVYLVFTCMPGESYRR